MTMDGLCELATTAAPFPIGGRVYYLKPLRLRDWAEAGVVLAERKRSPAAVLKDLLPGLDAESAKRAVELAYSDARRGGHVPQYEIDYWFEREPDGKVFQFWLAVRQQHPEITHEHAEGLHHLAECESAARVAAAMDKARGDPSGNSPSRPTNGETASPAGNQSPSPGVASSVT